MFFDIIAQKESWVNGFPRGGVSYLNYAKFTPGGSGNVAVGMALLGLKTAFIGKGGRDMLAKTYEDDLKHSGVCSKIFLDEELSTGLIVVLSEAGGERSFQVFRGANDNLTTEEIESTKKFIQSSKYLYVCGYSLTSPRQQTAILRAVELARQYRVKVVFDPGAFNLVELQLDLFQRLSSTCDVFCPNLKEAIAITQSDNIDTVIEILRERTKLSAIKLGHRGSILVQGRSDVIKTSALDFTISDTTGAGDAFAAALVYGLTRNLPTNVTLNLANWLAGRVSTSCGARSYPSKEEINHFLNKRKFDYMQVQKRLTKDAETP